MKTEASSNDADGLVPTAGNLLASGIIVHTGRILQGSEPRNRTERKISILSAANVFDKYVYIIV